MSTDELTKNVAVPGVVWLLLKWGCGLLGAGAVATLLICVSYAIDLNGRVSALEKERESLISSMNRIEQNTSISRDSIEDVKRDVAVLKSRGTP